MSPDESEPLIGFEITFQILPNKRREFELTAHSLLRDTAAIAPLREQAVFEQVGTTGRFLWSERWESASDLQERLASPQMETLIGAIQVLGEVHEVRLIGISENDSERGVELPRSLRKIRSRSGDPDLALGPFPRLGREP